MASATRLPIVYLALIEYGETAAPSCLTGTSEHVVMAAAINEVLRSEAAGLSRGFLRDHPRPDYNDASAVAAWLEALEVTHFVPLVSTMALPILPNLPQP